MNGTRSQPSAREMPKARWRLFTTSTGDISIARLHIGLGSYYLIYPLVGVFSQALLRRGSQVAANSDGPAAWPLLVALIILLVGGLALILETRTERLPDPALWPMPTGPTTDKPTFYWCDIAVLQLGLGVALVPTLASAYPSAVAAWPVRASHR